MNCTKLLLNFFIISIFSVSIISAQTGGIAGKVIEAESGFEIIGGNVVIKGTGTGSSTDLDGNYLIQSLEPGTYTLECSYIGFETKDIVDVVVESGKVTQMDIQMGETSIQLEVAVVTGKKITNTETALLAIQKKAPVILDGISSAQISKSGDNDVASAVKRVTGVTVEDGKYVYVRGLGDRYSKTTLNGATIPGLDPNRNTVQMDLFPTDLIDNIIIYKTFSPNLPGDFSGGYVDIATKDFPTSRTFGVSASAGYNSLATFNPNFLTYEGGATDWLGMDDGTRAIPEMVLNNKVPLDQRGSNIDAEQAQMLTDMTGAFKNNFSFQNAAPLPNYSLALSTGNQKQLFGKQFGYNAALTYRTENSYYQNGVSGIYQLTDQWESQNKLTTQLSLDDTKSSQKVLWGAMFNSSYKLSQNHKIGLTAMHNQSGTKTARFQEGKKQIDDPDDGYQTRTWQYLERAISTFQLKGKHVFENLNNTEVSWQSSYAMSSQDEPDLRFFTNRYFERADGSRLYSIKPSSDRQPVRYFRFMDEDNFDNKIDIAIPFNQWNNLSAKVKFGGAYLMKDREFREERFNYGNKSNGFSGDITQYFSEENILTFDKLENDYLNNGDGVFIVDAFVPANNYDAQQQVGAAYAMIELPLTNKLRAIAGARMESTTIQFFSYSEVLREKFENLDGESNLLDNTDILPSVNLNYSLTENMQIRMAYNKTLARPTFRELAPFESFDFMGGFILIGNPELQRTLVDNIDLRFEIYPNSGELISLSAFYKNFDNPIERTFNPSAPNGEFTFRNVDQATLLGAEVEVRKNLDFITEALSAFSLGANFTYVYSRSNIDSLELNQIRATNPDAKSYREMFGQSPYVVNALLSYKNQTGTSANLAFNVSGARISYITTGGTPNIYEMPRASLNFNIRHDFENGLGLRLAANNLLNARYQEAITFKGQEYFIQDNPLGRDFSIGVSFKIQ